jgi:hypothetical protein
MKNIFKILVFFITIVFVSCEQEYEDHMTGTAAEGGVIVQITDLNAAQVLGTPMDPSNLDTSSMIFTDVSLDYTISRKFGGDNVTKYEVVKSFIDNNVSNPSPTAEVVVATSTTLPMNVSLATVQDFIDGTGLTNESSLNVGDQFIFRLRVYNSNGDIYYERNADLAVTVACSSDLAGNYAEDYTGLSLPVVITEESPGIYRADYLPPFAGVYWWEFQDLCGTLYIVDFQFQASNPLTPVGEPVGYVDSNGNLVFEGLSVGGVAWYVDLDFTLIKQ